MPENASDIYVKRDARVLNRNKKFPRHGNFAVLLAKELMHLMALYIYWKMSTRNNQYVRLDTNINLASHHHPEGLILYYT